MVTLASIVEKETGKADERSRVAAVFVNRLRQKIKLQSDPTIIYGLVGGKGTLGRPIKRSEISQPSPYNTYVIEGLPPGPIANPGRASLEAAANPARTRDLFFVADGTGGHAFTETYDQHQKNVARLRTIEKQIQNDTAEPADDAPPPAAAASVAGRHQSDGNHEARCAEEARASGDRTSAAGRGAIDHHAAGGSAITRPERNSTFAEFVLRSRRSLRILDPPVRLDPLVRKFHVMALSSMTGFARSHGASGPYAFEWELKSVNAKGFDLRLRLPSGLGRTRSAGQEARRRIAVARNGLRQSYRQAHQRGLDGPYQRGRAGFDREGRGHAGPEIDAVAPSIDGLLSIKGVIEVVEPESDEAEDKAAKEPQRRRSIRR